MKTYILDPIAPEALAYARRYLDVVTWDDDACRHPADAEALMVRTHPVTREMIDAMPRLRVIARHGTGLDAIDTAYAKEKHILVQNTPLANVESVVEQVIGLILDCAHKITASHLAGIHGLKQKMPEFLCGCEITGKKLGLIGVGHIGSRVGRRLQAGFNMDVTAWSPHLTDDACRELGFHRAAGPEEIYQTCDVISVSVPLTEATHHMIGAKELRLFKPGSILINTSRGGIVDEDALCQALQENELFGAGFDTFLQEPLPADHVLFTCFNFVATPHNAANTKEAMIRMGTQAVDIIRNVEKE